MKLVLPFGAVIESDDIVSFQFNPPPEKSTDLPPGYVLFRNGESISLLPGDALALRNYYDTSTEYFEVSEPDEFKERLEAIELKKSKPKE